MSEALDTAVQDLMERARKLEQITSIVHRDIPLPCPFCGNYTMLKPQKTYSNMRLFCIECESCYSRGPGMQKQEEAVLGWNKFVSHHGKVPRE